MEPCSYPVYNYYWFWLIATGILFIAIGFIIWDSIKPNNVPAWVWVVIIGGIILAALGFILFLYYWFYRSRAIRSSQPGCQKKKKTKRTPAVTEPIEPTTSEEETTSEEVMLRRRLVEGKTVWSCE